jgi:hypothetical protein
MPTHGAVELDDTHPYKKVIKEKLGDDRGIGELLRNAGQTNFDFWVHRDGTIWISDNGEGGQGVETDQNFYDLFPEFKPAEVKVADQPNRYDSDSDEGDSDEGDDPEPGEVYDVDGGRRFLRHGDGNDYEVFADRQGNDYYTHPTKGSQWTSDWQ